ncbi:MAG: hypothetical protein NXH75_16090 [Halobacteriovoraceae bacterium]|nr:hypothetical protein [Halobacteriovoraceae bacterium]
MDLNKAIEMLRNAVKDSHLNNQKHIDLSLVDASERADYEKALMYCQASVARGELTDEELKSRLGLTA